MAKTAKAGAAAHKPTIYTDVNGPPATPEMVAAFDAYLEAEAAFRDDTSNPDLKQSFKEAQERLATARREHRAYRGDA